MTNLAPTRDRSVDEESFLAGAMNHLASFDIPTQNSLIVDLIEALSEERRTQITNIDKEIAKMSEHNRMLYKWLDALPTIPNPEPVKAKANY